MAKTGAHLKIRQMGENVMGVELKGNPKQPEPIHFRVMFPFGDVDVVRTEDDQYWVHVRVNQPEDGDGPDRPMGKIVDARMDIIGAATLGIEDSALLHPNLYHLALKLDAEPLSYREALQRQQEHFASEQ